MISATQDLRSHRSRCILDHRRRTTTGWIRVAGQAPAKRLGREAEITELNSRPGAGEREVFVIGPRQAPASSPLVTVLPRLARRGRAGAARRARAPAGRATRRAARSQARHAANRWRARRGRLEHPLVQQGTLVSQQRGRCGIRSRTCRLQGSICVALDGPGVPAFVQ